MKKSNINEQKIESSISSLDYRLDLLRLTFKIEELLENIIRNSLKQKKVAEEEFKKCFINECKYQEFKKSFKNKKEKQEVVEIWNKRKDEKVFFNVNNFIILNTFGELLKFIGLIKYDLIKSEIRKIIPNIEFKIFKKWMKYIKDVRNVLAHRTNINPNDFLEKTSFPAHSKNLETKKLIKSTPGELLLKKKIFVLFILEKEKDLKTKEILKKYDF